MDCGGTEHFTVRSWSWTRHWHKSKDRPPLQVTKVASKMQPSNTSLRYYHWQTSKRDEVNGSGSPIMLTARTNSCTSKVMADTLSKMWQVVYWGWQYLLTYSTVHSPSWAANWFAASQEIPRISRNLKVHHRTHKRPPPVSIPGQPNPVHIPTSHISRTRPSFMTVLPGNDLQRNTLRYNFQVRNPHCVVA